MLFRSLTLGDYNDNLDKTKIIIDDTAQTIQATGSVQISGSLSLNGVTGDLRPYKVYTALLTQTGGSNPQQVISTGGAVPPPAPNNIFKGVTYTISAQGGGGGPLGPGDFTPYGAPNNDVGTSFVANQDVAYYDQVWTLDYNAGAPVVLSELENTLGNVWFTYENIGQYNLTTDTSFNIDKVIGFAYSGYDDETLYQPFIIRVVDSYTINLFCSSGINNHVRIRLDLKVYN